MERRQHERYGLEAPVSFSWKNPGNMSQRSKGLLLNISGGGIFVATTDLPPEGARIRLSVSLRTVFAGTHLAIRASAELVRVEFRAGVGNTGFGAAIKRLTLRSNVKAIKGCNRQRGPNEEESCKDAVKVAAAVFIPTK